MDLSEQLSASNESVQKEQSRLLAKSGWNLALEQLQLYGTTEAIQHTVSTGEVAAEITENQNEPAAWDICATGQAGVYRREISGTVQCFSLPFANTQNWNVIQVQHVAEVKEASIVLLDDDSYQLQHDCVYPLGFTSTRGNPVQVEIPEEICVSDLYIYGDLCVSGTLEAEQIYVTGTVSGLENIQCDALYRGDMDEIPYQIRVLNRNAV